MIAVRKGYRYIMQGALDEVAAALRKDNRHLPLFSPTYPIRRRTRPEGQTSLGQIFARDSSLKPLLVHLHR